MKLGKIILWLLLLLLAALVVWLGFFAEWREQEIDLGFTDAANSNDFLAAQQMLEAYGLKSDRRSGFALIDNLGAAESVVAANDTLILLGAYNALNDGRMTKLLDWVLAGGTAIYTTQNPLQGNSLAAEESLLGAVGVEASDAEEVDAELPQSTVDEKTRQERYDELIARLTERQNPTRCSPFAVEVAFQASSAAQAATLSLDSEHVLQVRQEAQQFSDARGVRLLNMPLSAGRLVVTTDEFAWSNHKIGCKDNGYGLLQLVGNGTVWFLLNEDSEPLWMLLWHAFPFTLLACAVLALLAWHRQSRRFGSLMPLSKPMRRDFREHLQASATLLWQQQQGANMVLTLRETIAWRVQRRHSHYAQLSKQEQLSLLEENTGFAKSYLEHLLFSALPSKLTEADFLHHVQGLQKIRNAIERGFA
jgi:hypothetical protein